jgi:hypothetical protein
MVEPGIWVIYFQKLLANSKPENLVRNPEIMGRACIWRN